MDYRKKWNQGFEGGFIDKNRSIDPFLVMTVDVDGWSSLLRFYSVNHDPLEADLQVSVEEGIGKLLNLFKRHKVACHGLT